MLIVRLQPCLPPRPRFFYFDGCQTSMPVDCTVHSRFLFGPVAFNALSLVASICPACLGTFVVAVCMQLSSFNFVLNFRNFIAFYLGEGGEVGVGREIGEITSWVA